MPINQSAVEEVDGEDITPASVDTDGSVTAGTVSTDNSYFRDYPVAFGYTQSKVGDVTEHAGNNVTVSGNSYHTIFDLSAATELMFAEVLGPDAAGFRITWSDGSTSEIGSRHRGTNGAGDLVSNSTITRLEDVKKLEFFNGRGNPFEYGYQAVTL